MESENGVLIRSVTFSEETIEITYMEERNQTKFVHKWETIVADPKAVERELIEAYESLQDLIDAALLVMRNPPKKKSLFAKDDDGEDDEEAG